MYQLINSFLIYIRFGTKLDIIYTILAISWYAANLVKVYFRVFKRIFKQFKGIKSLALIFSGNLNPLEGYLDLDWADNYDIRKSTSRLVFNFRSGVISWSLKRQQTVALFSTEVEYIGQIFVIKEAVQLKRLYMEFNSTFRGEGNNDNNKVVIIYCDNNGAISFAKKPI